MGLGSRILKLLIKLATLNELAFDGKIDACLVEKANRELGINLKKCDQVVLKIRF